MSKGKKEQALHIEPELLRVKQVAALTGIHPRTLLRLRDGEGAGFPLPVRFGKRAIAWRRRDVMQWIESLQPSPIP